jgi:hypothetical protein
MEGGLPLVPVEALLGRRPDRDGLPLVPVEALLGRRLAGVVRDLVRVDGVVVASAFTVTASFSWGCVGSEARD